MPQKLDQRGNVIPGCWAAKYGYGQTVAYTDTAGTIADKISTIKATTTLTSNNTNVGDGEVVTIGNKTYTFKTILTPTEGEVLIGADADASLLNLINAINHTGTPDTDYKCAAAHTQVSAAAAVTAHAFLITALAGGSAANQYETNTDAATLSFTGLTLAGGVDNARNTTFIRVLCTTAAFVRIGVDPTAVNTDYTVGANVPEILPCNPGDKVSALRVASNGSLYIVELD